jgi:hypothetical protein
VPGAFFQLWFAVRYVHVASVALLIGGAFIMLAGILWARSVLEPAALFGVAAAYEWIFWSVVGVTAATGVSNLGLKGDGLLGPETTWGRALSVKLTAAFIILALSLIRTDMVSRCRAASGAHPERGRVVLAALYGLTIAVLLTALWLGLGLAHGRY